MGEFVVNKEGDRFQTSLYLTATAGVLHTDGGLAESMKVEKTARYED